ncbi:MAG: glycosyl hydrolase 53 family protein [Bacteroidales bacterium]|nr:glycosyl hydrolase 53 family protein [Bacteroidales bacterium]MBR5063491.1 glycosyl hydrolase 53 family protein [Bacteroidales bacterium]
MSKTLSIFLSVAALISACQQQPTDPGTDPEPDPPVSVVTPDFARGADVSWLSEMENDNKTFKKADGTPADLFEVLKDCGINSIRLRVWVDPPGGWSGKEDMVKLAVRAAKAGLALMVDFHYSDFFADPSRQTIPSAWASDKDDLEKMCSHVSAHTTQVLQALKDAGVKPAWIQIGNETRNGMLWPAGQLWTASGDLPDGRKHFAQLYNAGYDAAKAVFKDAVVMPHLNNAYEDNAWWFRQIKAEGGKFDAIALSHYPQAESAFSATQYNQKALANIKSLISEFKIPVYVSEVGVKPAKADAASVLKAFMDDAKNMDGCKGVFYWEPEVYGGWKPAVYSNAAEIERLTGKRETWGAYDQGAFTSDGRPHEIMNVFKQ